MTAEHAPDVCPNFDPAHPDRRPAACDVCGVNLSCHEAWTMCAFCDAMLHERCREYHECPVVHGLMPRARKEDCDAD